MNVEIGTEAAQFLSWEYTNSNFFAYLEPLCHPPAAMLGKTPIRVSPLAFRSSLSSNSERSDLRFEAWKPVFVKRDRGVYMINLMRGICKLVLKLDFTAHGIMESLSEFGLWVVKYGVCRRAENLTNLSDIKGFNNHNYVICIEEELNQKTESYDLIWKGSKNTLCV
jgi:hypothetical protein